MLISLNWLKQYIDIDLTVDELADRMTMLGLEIEAINRPGEGVRDVYIGQIRSIEPHPDADKLVVCKTDIGAGDPLQIVCGAKNMKVGDKVPTAVVGATLPGGFEIGARKMRGVQSQGMMCSAKELGLGDDHSGLMILPEDWEIGADALALLGLNDVIMEIEVIPNRGDWASMIGVARELAAALDTGFRVPAVEMTEDERQASSFSSVSIEDPELCPRYSGRVMTGITVGPSPQWLCERLIAAGQRPINNIVDITNFVLMETGHPLHAFDYDKLEENRVVVRRAKAGETIKTLDEETRKLDPDMLIIADARRPVAVAGIMGGHDGEVGEKTVNVFLESAWFDPSSVRRTARELNMQTEASQRFQRGADPEMVLYALNRAAALMQQLAGAQVAADVLDEYPNPIERNVVTLRYRRCDLLLGTAIKSEFQRKALENLGFEIVSSDQDSCTVCVPSWRHDVSCEADLIEEVARLHGYDRIETTLPKVRPVEHEYAPEENRLRKLRHFLVGQGLTEMIHWAFSCPEDVAAAQLGSDYEHMVVLENPLSEKQATMRPSLIPALLATVSSNIRHGNVNIMAFEIGPVFKPLPDSDLPEQKTAVTVVLSGTSTEKHWSRPQTPFDIFDLKGLGENIFAFFGLEADIDNMEFGTFQTGQSGSITLDEALVGRLGKVDPAVCQRFDIESQEVFLMELELDELLACAKEVVQFEPVPSYPSSLRDMAVLVDRDLPAFEILSTAEGAGGKLLKSVHVFDIYQGKQVPADKKSVALNLIFQSPDKTLTDKATQKSWDKILKALQKKCGAELR